MNNEILEVKNLSKTYSSKQVVKDVSLDVHAGEIVGLLGPNGAGKTTSFYMIVGLVKGERGTIYLGKTNITEFSLAFYCTGILHYIHYLVFSHIILIVALFQVEVGCDA